MFDAGIFYTLAAVILFFAAAVVFLPSPIYSALSLAVTMVGLGFMYYLLGAYFIAGVQLIVYAGAVMVLFVIVIMLFDLKKETEAFSGGLIGLGLKIACGIFFTAALALAVRQTVLLNKSEKSIATAAEQIAGVKELSAKLFTQYVFAFELLGVLLLLIAVGVVAVSRSKGGTHARD